MAKPKAKININIQTLQSLGLGENEAILYSKLLQTSSNTVQQLENLALFPRTMLYHVLNQLIGKGLVESGKSKTKTVFIAKDPDTLYELLHKKEKEFEREKQSVKELIPKLKNEFLLFGKVPNVRTFKGIEEYQKVLDECLLSKPIEIYSYEKLEAKKSGLEVRENFDRRRVIRKIKKNVLFFENVDSLKSLAKIQYNDFTNFRSAQIEDLSPFSTDVMLYDGKILYTSYPENKEPVAVLIEDKSLFEMQKNIFNVFWNSGKNRTLYYTETNK